METILSWNETTLVLVFNHGITNIKILLVSLYDLTVEIPYRQKQLWYVSGNVPVWHSSCNKTADARWYGRIGHQYTVTRVVCTGEVHWRSALEKSHKVAQSRTKKKSHKVLWDYFWPARWLQTVPIWQCSHITTHCASTINAVLFPFHLQCF